MKIADIYSHQNGYEHIVIHKRSLWAELEYALTRVDARANQRDVSDERPPGEQSRYDLQALIVAFATTLGGLAWRSGRSLESADAPSACLDGQPYFIKDRTACELHFGARSYGAYDLLGQHIEFYQADIIDVGIEILPMKAMSAEMSSSVCYYEGELYNVVRHGRGTPAVPLVLVGIAPG